MQLHKPYQMEGEGNFTIREFWWNISIKVSVARERNFTIKEYWWNVSIKVQLQEKESPPSKSFGEVSV
jgi:hypothetical protein